MIRVKSSWIWRLAVILAVASVSLRGLADVPDPEWWPSSTTDKDWTNRSVAALRDEALRNSTPGQYYLARQHFVGIDGRRDLRESFRWITKAAEGRHLEAEFIAGAFCIGAIGTRYDPRQGFQWLMKAAESGHARAMGMLGQAYRTGAGTPRDATKAKAWLLKGDQSGSASATRFLAEFYLHGEGGQVQRTNYTEALRLFESAAANGDFWAAISAGNLHQQGLGTPPGTIRAVEWIRWAVDRGVPDGMESLAGFYSRGEAEPRDRSETSTELLRRAVSIRARRAFETGPAGWQFNSSVAQVDVCTELWNRYRFGTGTPRDYLAAAQWMWQAWEENRRRIAVNPQTGSHVSDRYPFAPVLHQKVPPAVQDEANWSEAVQLIHRALELGEPGACRDIAQLYLDGSSLAAKDLPIARAWFLRAAQIEGKVADLPKALAELSALELQRAASYWIPRSRR